MSAWSVKTRHAPLSPPDVDFTPLSTTTPLFLCDGYLRGRCPSSTATTSPAPCHPPAPTSQSRVFRGTILMRPSVLRVYVTILMWQCRDTSLPARLAVPVIRSPIQKPPSPWLRMLSFAEMACFTREPCLVHAYSANSVFQGSISSSAQRSYHTRTYHGFTSRLLEKLSCGHTNLQPLQKIPSG